MVSANIQPDQTLSAELSGYYMPYTVINVGSDKVAVVGYTTAETPVLSMPGKSMTCCSIDEALNVFIWHIAAFQHSLELSPVWFHLLLN